MTFKDASSIQQAVQSMRLANLPAATNRARINSVMNGDPPWTEAELKENKGFTNVNFLEGSRIMMNARQQLHNAFIKPGDYFTCQTDFGPIQNRQEWSHKFTKGINKRLRRDREMSDLLLSMNALTALHGIAPAQWTDTDGPIPLPLGVEDVLVPARTLTSMRNLEFFAIFREWTFPELFAMSHAPQADAGWNQPLVKSLLAWLREQPLQSQLTGMRWMMPEKVEEDFKENSGWYASNVAPTISVWDFAFLDERGDEPLWQRRIVLDCFQSQNGVGALKYGEAAQSQFLYDSSKRGNQGPPSWQQVIHWQFGDCSNVAPFRYGSVRSLGYLLYHVTLLQNILRCRFSDATFESMLTYFRNVGEDDRERIEKVDLLHMGIIPDGLSFVTRNERAELNTELVSLGLMQNRQLMADSSASWISNVETGSTTPRTATEEMIKAQTSAALLSAVLNQAYHQATFMYREIVRRFCIHGSRSPMVRSFQAEMLVYGVPEYMFNAELWDVEPERVLGGGNKTMEVLQADRLMSIQGGLDPDAQRIVLRKFVVANTDDPDLADQLVPEGPKQVSDAALVANSGFGVLMQSLPFNPPRGINEVDYIETVLQLLALVAQQIPQLESQPEIQATKIAGAVNAAANCEEHIKVLAQNPQEKQRVTAYQQALTQLLGSIQPHAQQIQQSMGQAQEQQIDPETQAKIQALLIQAKAKANIRESDAAHKQQLKDAAFHADLQRRNANTAAQIQTDAMKTRSDIASQDAKTAAELMRAKRENELSQTTTDVSGE